MERVRELMRADGLDALIAFASRGEHGSVRYLTGFEPWLTPEQWAFAVLRPAGEPVVTLVTNSPWDFAWPEHRTTTWADDIVLPTPPPETPGLANSATLPAWVAVDWCQPLLDALPADAQRVAIAGWHSFPARVYEELRARAPSIAFGDGTALVRRVRAVKSATEIALLAAAGAVGDAAGAAFVEEARVGRTEREVTAAVDAAMIVGGTQQLAYWTNLAAGPRTVTTCFLPTSRAIGDGELVQLDCGPMVEGYKADFSRVTVAGKPSQRALRLVETVAAAYEACATALAPGVECRRIAETGLDVIRASGYTNENLYVSLYDPDLLFMAHGIGLENPDPPGMVSLGNHSALEEGMVINLEPIVVEPGLGAARIEGAFVVEAAGARPLSHCEIRPWLR